MNIYNVGGGGGVVVGVIDIRLLPSLAKKYKYLILLHHMCTPILLSYFSYNFVCLHGLNK